MAVTTLTLLVTNEETGEVVNDGDVVTDFRGDTATLVMATRARVPGKSGKVLYERVVDGESYRMECYDGVFGLHVAGILTCGCDHYTVWEHGHREGCSERKS